MSTGAIIAIVIGVLIVLALVLWLSRRGRAAKLESRRHEAREIRREAEVRSAEADQTTAEADERAARARQEEAQARATAARADEQRQEADAHHARAHEVDPDTKGAYDPDRDRSTTDAGAATTSPDDAHYDRPDDTTADADADRSVREVHEERTTTDPDRDPEVVREEERRTEEYRQ